MTARVSVDGKHLRLDGAPFRIRGATYGSFLPRVDGERFPGRPRVKDDLRAMADAGLNTLRTYDLPPVDVLETAEDNHLRVLVGVHYHDWRLEPVPGRAARRRILDAGRRAVDLAIERCASLPHVIGIAVANEIAGDVVRVHGIHTVEDTLSDLISRIHDATSDLLATYVNYPTTEYLDVENLDVVCFNVFLEDPQALRRYLRHLQVVAGTRPLVITELGLSATVHGEQAQADSLAAQLHVVDESGCAGATVFSWTDEWAVDVEPVSGWGFGITTEDRVPKPALDVVRAWTDRDLTELRDEWPSVSVVVCAYNTEATIADCLRSLAACRYPALDVIVCDDGSTDRTLEIAQQFPFRVLALDRGGLSRARNAGLAAAVGEIVAYLDADAACHPDWPFHLVLSLNDDGVVATGGPNLGVPGVGLAERAIDAAPGNAAEVLLADDRAEHVPGCNMAYHADVLRSIDGFDPAYTAAGDDVDVCWKLLDRGGEIAFAPAAQVLHHRRASVRGYLRQQRGYGNAERMLSGAHPHRFNRAGQVRWRGIIYGGAGVLPSLLRPVIYHGHEGTAPFQPVTMRRSEAVGAWATVLEPATIPIAIAGAVLGALGVAWGWLLLAIAAGYVVAHGVVVAAATRVPRDEVHPLAFRALVGALHVVQPIARAWGRIRGRPLPRADLATPEWSGSRHAWIREVERALRSAHAAVRTGTPSDTWDLEASFGPLVAARITTAVIWNWVPQWRRAYRLRARGVIPAAAVCTIAGAVDPLAGAVALGLLVAAVIFEWVRLHRSVERVLAQTTVGLTSS